MTPEQVPQELVDILDQRAGRRHSRTGSVIACLAEILTRYDQIQHAQLEWLTRSWDERR